MASVNHPTCQALINLMMDMGEFIEDIHDAREDLADYAPGIFEPETDEAMEAHLARAAAYVLGEFIANEWETPDSDRCPGFTRERAIADWHEAYALRYVAAERVAPRNCDC